MKKWYIWGMMFFIAVFLIVSTTQADDPPKIKKKAQSANTASNSLKAAGDSSRVSLRPPEIRRPGEPITAACLKTAPPKPAAQLPAAVQPPLPPGTPMRFLLRHDSVRVMPALKKGATPDKAAVAPLKEARPAPHLKQNEKKKDDK